jgi:probable rRNA maturation factor
MTPRPQRQSVPAFAGGDGSQFKPDQADAPNGEPPQPRVSLLDLDIVIDDEDWSAFGDAETIVTIAATAAAEQIGSHTDKAEVTIALSSDAEVAALNGTFRGKPKPTNVLSFPAAPQRNTPPYGVPKPLGDIIIARQTVLREAADLGIPPSHHLSHLVVHGLLHLCGYDHETDQEAGAMEALETTILATIGIPDPYSGSDPIPNGAISPSREA